MNKQERIQQLLARIAEDKSGAILSTRARAQEFAVSEITVRRDRQERAGAGLSRWFIPFDNPLMGFSANVSSLVKLIT